MLCGLNVPTLLFCVSWSAVPSLIEWVALLLLKQYIPSKSLLQSDWLTRAMTFKDVINHQWVYQPLLTKTVLNSQQFIKTKGTGCCHLLIFWGENHMRFIKKRKGIQGRREFQLVNKMSGLIRSSYLIAKLYCTQLMISKCLVNCILQSDT